MIKWYFSWVRWFMKMDKKQCTKCKNCLLFECFKNNKKTRQLTKFCVKCLDNCKKLSQQTKCRHGRQRSYSRDCGGSQICEHSKIKKRMPFLWGKSNLQAQQDKIILQRLWRRSDLWAQQEKITMQGLWRKPDLWARQDKITMQRLRSPWTPCRGSTVPYLCCLEKR